MSASQFVCSTLGIPPLPPARAAPITASDCWLCGGSLDDNAWPFFAAVRKSTLSARECRVPGSDGVCWQCMALRSAEVWNAYVSTTPDDNGMKRGKLIGWRNSSHLISHTTHRTPSRAEWRDHLLSPPEPPFVAVFAVSTQLQIIGLAEIAHSREAFSLQLDRDQIWIDQAAYAECLGSFETLYAMGLTKDQISTGEIPNIEPYRQARATWLPWLTRNRELVRVVALVAQRQKEGE